MYGNYEFTLEDLFAAYLRKSQSDDPNEPIEITLAKHKARVLESAKRYGINENQITFFEEVVSGDTIAERPEIQKLLHLVSEGHFKGTFVVAVDRFSRGDSIDQGIIDQTFFYSGTLILTPEKIFDIANNEMDREQLEFGLFMSKREYNLIKKRMYAGRVDNVKAGYFVSSVTPYGYDKKRSDDKRGYILTPHEYESKIVKMIFEMFIEGIGTSNLAHQLNDIKAKPRKAKVWTPAMVRNILISPVYCGELIWNRSKVTKKMVNGQVIKKVEYQDKYYTFKGKHEPLITKEEFELAQQKLKSNSTKKVPKNKEMKNPLAGLIYCGYCKEHFNEERNMFRRPYQKKKNVLPKRKYDFDRQELLNLLREHKEKKGLSLYEIAKTFGLSKYVVDHWFATNIKKFHTSEKFTNHWYELKELLDIKTDKFDKAITTYIKDDDPHIETMICTFPKCQNVSCDLYLVEERLLQMIEFRLKEYQYIKDNYEQEIIKVSKKNNTTIKVIDKELEKLNTRLNNIMEYYELGDYTREQFLTRKNDITDNIEKLTIQKNKLIEEKQEDKIERITKAIPIFKECLKEYKNLNIQEQNELLKAIINKAIYTKKNKGRWDKSAIDNFTLEVDFKI